MAYSDKIATNAVPFFLYRAKILNCNPFTMDIDFLKDLDHQTPQSIHKSFKLTNSIMIRAHGAGDIKR